MPPTLSRCLLPVISTTSGRSGRFDGFLSFCLRPPDRQVAWRQIGSCPRGESLY